MVFKHILGWSGKLVSHLQSIEEVTEITDLRELESIRSLSNMMSREE
jgi:hypothetical protein